jgi:hypothetical protein
VRGVKTAKFIMVRVKLPNRWIPPFPVPLYVVNELLDALTDLVWVGEVIIKLIPLPHEKRAQKHLLWIKAIPFSSFLSVTNRIIRDFRKHKGLEIVDVETGDVQVKIHLR